MGRGVVAGVSLQDDRGRATETGEFAVLGDAEVWRSACEHRVGHLFLDDGAKAGPGGGEVAGDENDFRGERGGDETQAATEVGCLAGDGGDGGGVAFFGEAEEVVDVDWAGDVCALGSEFGVVAQGGGRGGEDLPAAALAAAADWAGGVDGAVAELAGEAAAAGDDLPVGEDGAADAFGDSDEHGVADAVETAGPEFGEETGVGGVGEFDLKLHLLFHGSLDVVVGPLEVGREEETLGFGVDAAGHADADAFEGAIAVCSAHGLHALDDLGDGARGFGDERDGFAGEEASVEVYEGDDGLIGTNVRDEDDHRIVEREKGRGAAARAARHGSFSDPLFFDQLLDDGGDGAGLQSGGAGEVGAGYGLLRADDLEDDVAIDVARVFAGCEFDVGEVDALDATSSVRCVLA